MKLVLYILYLLLDLLISPYLYSIGINITLFAQNYQLLLILAKVFTFLGTDTIYGFWILYLWLSFSNKIEVFKVIAIMTIVAGTMTTFKLIYQDPRPIFIYSEVKVYECAYEYGNPSGHCYGAIILYQLIFDCIVFQKHKIQEQTDSFQYMYSNLQNLSQNLQIQDKVKTELYDKYYPNSLLSYKQLKFALYVFIMCIAFSRLILGVHSLNQLILGLVYGLILLELYHKYLSDFLDCFLNDLIRKSYSKIQLFTLIGIILILEMIDMILFYRIQHNQEQQETQRKWLASVYKYCPINRSQEMEVKCFKDSSIYTLLLFLVVALALKKGSYKPTYFPLEMELKKDAIRLVIFLMLLIFPVIILRFGINSMTDAYLIHFSLCGLWLLVSLNWIYGVPAVYQRFKVDYPGDLLRNEQENEIELT